MEQEHELDSVYLVDCLKVSLGPESKKDFVQITSREVVFWQAFVDSLAFKW
jgi:hypothetical protein